MTSTREIFTNYRNILIDNLQATTGKIYSSLGTIYLMIVSHLNIQVCTFKLLIEIHLGNKIF